MSGGQVEFDVAVENKGKFYEAQIFLKHRVGPSFMPATYAINMHHFWNLMLFMFLLTAAPAATSVQTASAFTMTSNNAEMDLLGSLSDVFTPNPLAIMPAPSVMTTPEADAQTNFSGSTFAATQSASNVINQVSIIC